MTKISIDKKIITVLRKAAAIKDRIDIRCHKELRYYGRNKGYLFCIKCYPYQLIDLNVKKCPHCGSIYTITRKNNLK
jgi:rubrerythrin